ncbi:MAG TPA: FCD domain-containing protein [Baekduia sp.]|nr:FCD domain-containing protein [Baekduia sp.]
MSFPTSNIERPVRRNLAQAVAEQLMQLITSGQLTPGERLPSEADLKDRFGVGRSTIREALNGLVLLGAIEVRHGQGAVVVGAPTSAQSALDGALRKALNSELLEAREVMEIAIARRAAERASDEDLERLKGVLDAAGAKVACEGTAIPEATQFHLVLAEAAKNRIFAEFLQSIMPLLEQRGDELRQEGYAEWELEAHRIVFDAVASGDEERAARAMARHLQDMRSILRDGWPAFRLRLPI